MVAWMRTWVVVGIVISMGAASSRAQAQPLGTFRWQTQPYCNVLTLTIVQDGSQYRLDGTDDQCGASRKAGVVGLGFPNPDGTIGFGLTVVTAPGGTPLHLDATFTPPSLGGSWRDSAGATGAWSFTPAASTGGNPRPAPRVVFPAGLSAGNSTVTNVGAPVAGTDAATKAYADAGDASNSAADRAFAHGLATRALHLGPYSMVATQGTIRPQNLGCVSLNQGSIAWLDIPVPRGAVLTGAQVSFFQNAATDNAEFRLFGMDQPDGPSGSAGIPGGTFRTLGFGGTSHNKSWTFLVGLAPTSAFRSYAIMVSGLAVTNIQVCGIDITYTLP